MSTATSKEKLKKLSSQLLKTDTHDEDSVREIINDICYLYQDLTGILGTNTETEYIINVPTAVGISLSLTHAATCMVDYKRTTRFLKGFVRAIKDKQQEFPNETIRIFYAGCGPFAPFMSMVAPLFSKEEVQFTLLEVNKKSMEVVKDMIEKTELSEYVDGYHIADAITFEIPEAKKYHILFSETLDALLNREGYVPILWNLLPQLSENITVIPENVVITVNYKKESQELPFVTAFDTRKKLKETPKTDLIPERLAPNVFSLEEAKDYDSIVLDTVVKIYKDEELQRAESSLSLALEVPIQKPVIHESVEFVYTMKPTPGLQFGVK